MPKLSAGRVVGLLLQVGLLHVHICRCTLVTSCCCMSASCSHLVAVASLALHIRLLHVHILLLHVGQLVVAHCFSLPLFTVVYMISCVLCVHALGAPGRSSHCQPPATSTLHCMSRCKLCAASWQPGPRTSTLYAAPCPRWSSLRRLRRRH